MSWSLGGADEPALRMIDALGYEARPRESGFLGWQSERRRGGTWGHMVSAQRMLLT